MKQLITAALASSLVLMSASVFADETTGVPAELMGTNETAPVTQDQNAQDQNAQDQNAQDQNAQDQNAQDQTAQDQNAQDQSATSNGQANQQGQPLGY